MPTVQVDPQAVDEAASNMVQAALDLDGVRIDLSARTSGLAGSLGDAASERAAGGLLIAADRFLLAARDELLAVATYASGVAAAVRHADAGGRGG